MKPVCRLKHRPVKTGDWEGCSIVEKKKLAENSQNIIFNYTVHIYRYIYGDKLIHRLIDR